MGIAMKELRIETDEEGYLIDPEAWDDQVAETLARQEGVELGSEHRKVLDFIRHHYDTQHVAVDARFVIKYIAEELGYGDRARQRLYELFPYGYMQQVCKIAGMRRPRAWSTG
ncbi:MAG: TusE/DsrC/DsvC family sulfur relay protein [Thioalkalivibrio sp.]